MHILFLFSKNKHIPINILRIQKKIVVEVVLFTKSKQTYNPLCDVNKQKNPEKNETL